MRTTDGKLAILDFGLMTEITDDQKYGKFHGAFFGTYDESNKLYFIVQ